MKKTYKGSCHCRRVSFEADIDFAEGMTSKCSCSFCWKRRWWSVPAATDGFRLLSGADQLRAYPRAAEGGPGGFCQNCGVTPFAWVDKAEWNEGEYVSVNVACLDDLDPAELIGARTHFCDGKADNWWSPPAETRHL